MERRLREFLRPLASLELLGDRNKSGAPRPRARGRRGDRYVPFALPMSLQGSVQLEGEIGASGNGRGGRGEGGGRRDWHPAKRRCVIGDADAGKRNTQA